MSRLRVAILADFPWSALSGDVSGRGGGQGCTWLPPLAGALEAYEDFDIHWVVMDRLGHGAAVEKKWGQTFHRLKGVKMSVDLALRNLPTRLAIRKVLKEIRPEVIHAWGAELIYPSAIRDFDGPSIFSMQGSLTEYWRIGGLPKDWRWKRMVADEPGYVREATVVSAESIWASERVRELKSNVDCRVVDYGVHPCFYEAVWAPDPGAAGLLYVGGGGYRKGIDVLLEALKLLPERKWVLRFAGDEGLRKEVEESGVEGVEYLGMLRWESLVKEMERSWGLVMPTRCDTGPTVVKESRVVGMPVVGTRHGGLRDYVDHRGNGWVVQELAAGPLAEAMEWVMQSYEHVLKLGRHRHGEDREAFHPSLCAKKFTSLYRELAARRA